MVSAARRAYAIRIKGKDPRDESVSFASERFGRTILSLIPQIGRAPPILACIVRLSGIVKLAFLAPGTDFRDIADRTYSHFISSLVNRTVVAPSLCIRSDLLHPDQISLLDQQPDRAFPLDVRQLVPVLYTR